MSKTIFRISLISLALVLVLLAITGYLTLQPSRSADEVISLVQVYGVPILEIKEPSLGTIRPNPFIYNKTYRNPAPIGVWSTVYEGHSQWRIQGTVIFNVEQENHYYNTTWLLTGTKLRCISILRR